MEAPPQPAAPTPDVVTAPEGPRVAAGTAGDAWSDLPWQMPDEELDRVLVPIDGQS